MSDKDTSCYIYTCRMEIHTALTHCIATHFFFFFPAISTTEHGERSRVRSVELPLQTEKRKNTVRFTNADWSKDTLFRYDFFKNRYTYGREV